MKRVLSYLKDLFFSFRLRLTLWFVLILAVILGAFSVFIYFRQEQVLRAEAANRLLTQTGQLEDIFNAGFVPQNYENENEYAFENENDEGEADTPALSQEFSLLQNYDMLALIDQNGRVLQKSEYFTNSDLLSVYNYWQTSNQSAGPFEYKIQSAHDDGYRLNLFANRYLFIGAQIGSVQSGVSMIIFGTPIDGSNQLPTLAVVLVIVYGVTLLIAFGGGFWLANRAMRPVQVITRTARSLSEHDLNKRLNLRRRDELGELAATFDKMLDRLQAAFERQRQFTADASHELRTPLTIIELETNRALERSRSQSEYQQTLAIIQSENEGMSRMVNQLLTLARLDSGRLVLKEEQTDLAEIAADAVERLASLAEVKQVALQIGDLEKCSVSVDRNYLTNVISNLIENGLNYSSGPDARVTVSTGRELQKTQVWGRLRVSDNGPGIPPEHLPHLFDRFYRVSESRSRNEGSDESATGSGLGLAIAQSIIQAMNGKIDVTSKVGEGTIFTIWLPGLE